MPRSRALEIFSQNPTACLVLAALLVVVAILFPSGWIPASAIPRYFPGHEWFMAALCLILAAFFAWCAVAGLRWRGKDVKRQ
ncbi:MAG: hypothetical protein ABI648_02620 [Betaproteobacteria bacterium]|jgi:fumarate reductase subunit D